MAEGHTHGCLGSSATPYPGGTFRCAGMVGGRGRRASAARRPPARRRRALIHKRQFRQLLGVSHSKLKLDATVSGRRAEPSPATASRGPVDLR